MTNKKTKIFAIIVLILAGLATFAYQKVKQFADRPINVSSETIFTLPAGTGRVVLETLLIDKKLAEVRQPLLVEIERVFFVDGAPEPHQVGAAEMR
ncbi:hypothetical protein, partial [Gilvibacter sp.]|uniref:hypothetical protein n=1 Tax=Gilvibacter sp. TaxID=2729997 RepID=UPI0035BE299E